MRNSLLETIFGKIATAALLLLFAALSIAKLDPQDLLTLSSTRFYSFCFPLGGEQFWLEGILGLILYYLAVFLWINTTHAVKLMDSSKSAAYGFASVYLCLWPELLFQLNVLVALLCFVGIGYFFFKIYKQLNIQSPVFFASLLLALASFFFWPSIYLLPVFWAGIASIRPFQIKDYFISLIGFGLPFLYFFGIAYALDFNTPWPSLSGKEISFSWNRLSEGWSLGLVLMGFVAILGLYNMALRSKMIVLVRNQKAFLLLCLILSVVLSFFFGIGAWLFSLFPALVFFDNALNSIQKKWPFELLLLLFLLAGIVQTVWV